MLGITPAKSGGSLFLFLIIVSQRNDCYLLQEWFHQKRIKLIILIFGLKKRFGTFYFILSEKGRKKGYIL